MHLLEIYFSSLEIILVIERSSYTCNPDTKRVSRDFYDKFTSLTKLISYRYNAS